MEERYKIRYKEEDLYFTFDPMKIEDVWVRNAVLALEYQSVLRHRKNQEELQEIIKKLF